MPERHLPVRPDLEQLKRQAKELLRELRAKSAAPDSVKLADAQLALARSYGVRNWPRLKLACTLIDAIWEGRKDEVRALIEAHPQLLEQNARGTQSCNWGTPLSYAANVGDNAIVDMLLEMGGSTLQHAFERACLRGKLPTARFLFERGARPQRGSVMGPCETLRAEGLAFQLELGAELVDENGDRLAPLALALETYSRYPDGKHGCLEIFAKNGYALPDTPAFAVHRGRIDLLEKYVARDPGTLNRPLSIDDIFPLALGCHEDRTLALCGTPLGGGTLLHLCVDYDELDLARWLLESGADPNAPAARDSDGFGGHTPLFGCAVNQPYRCSRDPVPMTTLLLEHGADPSVRASLRKELRFVRDETLHEYRDVTARQWGERFHDQDWVSREVLALLN